MVKKIGIVILIINLAIINLYIGYQVYLKLNSSNEISELIPTASNNLLEINDECGEKCRAYVDQKISESLLTKKEATSSSEKIAATAIPRAKIKSTYYLPIPGTGSIISTDWKSISGTDFYMNKIDYPGLIGVYMEINMRLLNGNGIAYIRLYDVTHSIAVSGSEVQTSSQISNFVSSSLLSLWEGNNHYQIQAKSLTADTTVFESGRLKIITEN